MAFVKLDCGLLDSTLWSDRDARELFITALLMAQPYEMLEPAEQIEVRTLQKTGFVVPVGWYGFVKAAGLGIIRRSGMDEQLGFAALERLGIPELDSRTPEFDGRRMVRINGGYIILNWAKYREKDHTAAERSKRYRKSKMKPRVRKSTNSGPLKGEVETLAKLNNGQITQEQADASAALTREFGNDGEPH